MPEPEGSLDHVFTPIRVGGLELPHRIAMGSMHLGLEGAEDAGARLAAFYRERAEGGAGLIVTGGWAVSPDGAADDSYGILGPGWVEAAKRALAEVARATEGTEARIALQLFHAGRYALADSPGEVVAPSAVTSRVSRIEPRALGEEEVWDAIADFAAGAHLAQELGFAAVEIMGSEGYLVDQFLSPTTNLRDDAWGGDPERRMRFGIELATAVREAVGADFPVLFRMTGAELMPQSRPWEEVVAFAQALTRVGIDALNVGVGWHEAPVPTVQGAVPSGAFVPWASALKQSAAGPVIAGNRVNRLEDAEALLAAGSVDLISMSRPFLADPRLMEKGKGRAQVNVCISCDQACIDRSLIGGHVSCLVNPRSGFEVDFPVPSGSAGGGRYVVIGGGPAGLEAARALAALGGEVHLFEAREELGGQFRWARMVPGKEDYGSTISYFEAELERLGVTVHLCHEVGEDDADLIADCVGVVLATGVHPREVDIPGSDLPHVVDYATAFEDGLREARSIAIIGAGGIGVDLAHFLTHEPTDLAEFYERYRLQPPSAVGNPRRRGISNHAAPGVTLMRRSGRVGSGIGITTRWVWLDALKQAGVETRTGHSYRRITPDGVEIELEDGTVETIAAERVVIAAGQERRDELRPWLERLGVPLRVVGGAEDPGELNAVRAFGDGLRAAYALAG
jgi:2,4-dienoyl-CoA reductase (NADPH2)